MCVIQSFALCKPVLNIGKRCVSYRKKPTAQTAHLVFADTKANAEKPKELFFANALTEIERINDIRTIY